jgi:acetylornithine/N-succinyldiaminopimelate aminotransferase
MASHLMNAYNRLPITPVRGEGCYLYDTDGRRYLDFLSGVAVNAFGHCHPALVSALERQARTLWHTSNIVQTPAQEAVAARICDVSFADQVFFTNSGTESVELALKLVRRYFKATATPERWRTITFRDGFHGRTMAAVAAGGQAKLTQGYEPVVPGFDCVEFGDTDAVQAAIGPETAAILLEPIQGEGGVRVLPDATLIALRQIADDHGLLLALDEVQTGFGRTGDLFAFERSGIRPDIVACAKALGSGFPIGAVLTTQAVGATIVPGSHGTTLGGAPLAMAVAGTVLDLLLAEGFLEQARDVSTRLHEGLERLSHRYPHILPEVRGRGHLLGLRCGAFPNVEVMATLRDYGLLTAPAGHNVIRLLPPLILEARQVDEALAAVDAACQRLNDTKGPATGHTGAVA